jgi:thymidine kinase
MDTSTLHNVPRNTGWIEVVCGCMFSGKTEELIRRLRRAQIAKQEVAIFKPKIDDRYSSEYIVSHSDQSLNARVVENASEILALSADAQVIGIDEGQFFNIDIIDVCNRLADSGKRVIVAGLDQDYTGKPFEPMPQLLAIAEYITKTLAICVVCGNPADRTQRKNKQPDRVIVGAKDLYEARCRNCHQPPEKM